VLHLEVLHLEVLHLEVFPEPYVTSMSNSFWPKTESRPYNF